MLARRLAPLCAAVLSATAASGVAAADLTCTVVSYCTASGCTHPPQQVRFGLRIEGAATVTIGAEDSPETVSLPAYPGPAPDRMQVFSGLDGNGFVILSLRHDGAVTLSLHAGRSPGAFANNSTLSMGRCEETT